MYGSKSSKVDLNFIHYSSLLRKYYSFVTACIVIAAWLKHRSMIEVSLHWRCCQSLPSSGDGVPGASVSVSLSYLLE